MEVAARTARLAGDVIVLVEQIDVAEAVGGGRRLPVIPGREARARLRGKASRVAGGPRGGDGRGGSRPPRRPGNNARQPRTRPHGQPTPRGRGSTERGGAETLLIELLHY